MFNKSPRPETPEAAEASNEEDLEEVLPQAVTGMGEAEPKKETGEDWAGKYQLLQDQFTRLAADFDNYRKRTREEQESLVKYGAQKSIMELLPVLDNLERATGSLNENSEPKQLYKSFSMIQKQLLDGLDSIGVKKIQAIGKPFDPQLHEAVNRMESAEFPEDTIMYEAQSGYQLHDKVIRPAMVVVSTGAGAESPANSTESAPAAKPTNPFAK